MGLTSDIGDHKNPSKQQPETCVSHIRYMICLATGKTGYIWTLDRLISAISWSLVVSCSFLWLVCLLGPWERVTATLQRDIFTWSQGTLYHCIYVSLAEYGIRGISNKISPCFICRHNQESLAWSFAMWFTAGNAEWRLMLFNAVLPIPTPMSSDMCLSNFGDYAWFCFFSCTKSACSKEDYQIDVLDYL